MGNVELGLGTIGLGREWGTIHKEVPNEEVALSILQYAFHLGIRFFDTAPAYGLSEERVGKFLDNLSIPKKNEAIISTKFGEHWVESSCTTFIDHSYDSLKRSVDDSLKKLGRIDLLQIHKTSPDVLRSSDLNRAIEYAKSNGIKMIGASVSDEISGQLVCEDSRINVIQIPYNVGNTKFKEIIKQATNLGKTIIINRPFNTGVLLGTKVGNEYQAAIECFRFILENDFNGYILTGTKTPKHLEDNVRAFEEAKKLF